MENFDDNRIIYDDDIEVKFDENKKIEEEKVEINSFSNKNVSTNSFFSVAFSKKFVSLTLSSCAIILTLFMKFLIICGAQSKAFLGLWFFICATLSTISLIFNLVHFAIVKKFEFNVSSIINIISLLFLFLI